MRWLKIMRMGAAWMMHSTKVRYPPMDVAIEPTNICNYRCSYCPQSDPRHHELPHGFMKLDHLDIILDKVWKAGAAWHNIINYTHDGEPLLHPEFPEFLRRATVRGFRTRFSSNGSKLTPDKVDRLTGSGASFRVSIDFSGSREAFETYRSKRGDWESVRDNIAYVIQVSNANPRVRVGVYEMCAFADPEASQRQLSLLKSVLPKPTSDRVQFHIRNFHNAAGLIQLNVPRQGKPRHHCPYPWTSLNIAWNGDVHACPRDLRGQTKLGNLLEAESLDAIWNGERYQEFRRRHAAGEVDQLAACSGCDLPWRDDRQRWSLRHIWFRLRS